MKSPRFPLARFLPAFALLGLVAACGDSATDDSDNSQGAATTGPATTAMSSPGIQITCTTDAPIAGKIVKFEFAATNLTKPRPGVGQLPPVADLAWYHPIPAGSSFQWPVLVTPAKTPADYINGSLGPGVHVLENDDIAVRGDAPSGEQSILKISKSSGYKKGSFYVATLAPSGDLAKHLEPADGKYTIKVPATCVPTNVTVTIGDPANPGHSTTLAPRP